MGFFWASFSFNWLHRDGYSFLGFLINLFWYFFWLFLIEFGFVILYFLRSLISGFIALWYFGGGFLV